MQSPGMRAVVRAAIPAAESSDGVLIRGESGTGKQTIAKAIHAASALGQAANVEALLREGPGSFRDASPFVTVDCTRAQEVERAIFGAQRTHHAAPEQVEPVAHESALHRAMGGTLFLRAVHEMPGRVQRRLARTLRDGEVILVPNSGAPPTLTAIGIRVIASTDPSKFLGDDRITPELEKHLARHRIDVPPLRHRKQDLPALVRRLLGEACDSFDMPKKGTSRQALSLLCALPWHGNIRELQEMLRTIASAVPGPLIRVTDILTSIRLDERTVSFVGNGTLKEAKARFERDYIAAILARHNGRMAEAAKVLGMQRTNLYRKVKQLAVSRPGRA